MNFCLVADEAQKKHEDEERAEREKSILKEARESWRCAPRDGGWEGVASWQSASTGSNGGGADGEKSL